jgi:hypothetical protein
VITAAGLRSTVKVVLVEKSCQVEM